MKKKLQKLDFTMMEKSQNPQIVVFFCTVPINLHSTVCIDNIQLFISDDLICPA